MTREFILKSLLPYKEDPARCGYDPASTNCMYLTPDGKKCAVGQYLNPGKWQLFMGSVKPLFANYGTGILTDEAREQKIPIEVWESMQAYHDKLAKGHSILTDDDLDDLERETGYKFPELRFAPIL